MSAIAVLKKYRVDFTEHEYRYEERGGTAVSSRELGIDEHSVIKRSSWKTTASGR
jgi:hypothetical protein